MTDFLEKENCIRNMNKQIHGKVLSSQEKKTDETPYLDVFAHVCQQDTESKVTEKGAISNWSWNKNSKNGIYADYFNKSK